MNSPNYRSRNVSRFRGIAIACFLIAVSLGATAQMQNTPRDIVRTAIQHELQDDSKRSRLFTWKERKLREKDIETERIIETPTGVLSRVVLINGKPLNPEQQRQEEARIRKMRDPAQLERKKKDRQEDDERTNKMLATIPDAFDFQQIETTQGTNGHKLTRLSFTARPGFSPPSRESMVFTGMQGEMLIDETVGRLVKIDGTLFKEVNFGWGILGKLYKGGRFVVEQSEITPGHWDTTRMILHFDGKALFVKSIHIDEDESSWDYQPVPPMSVQQALEFLNSENPQNAQLRP